MLTGVSVLLTCYVFLCYTIRPIQGCGIIYRRWQIIPPVGQVHYCILYSLYRKTALSCTWLCILFTGQFIALPHRPDAYDLMTDSAKLATHPHISQRLKAFGGGRKAVYYDDKLQAAHHIHYSSDRDHRVLQHHYGTCYDWCSLCVYGLYVPFCMYDVYTYECV